MKGSSVVAGFCFALLTTACGSSFPTGPSSAASGPVSVVRASEGTREETALSLNAARAVPFKGSLEGRYGTPGGQFPLIQESISASGDATHLGHYTLAIEETVNFLEATATGTFTFTAANGDTVSGSFNGKAQPGPVVSITEEAKITGGTGRFAGATGSFVIDRLFDPANRTTTGSFGGAISFIGARAD